MQTNEPSDVKIAEPADASAAENVAVEKTESGVVDAASRPKRSFRRKSAPPGNKKFRSIDGVFFSVDGRT
ncbi:MAG: hypothetical protein IJE97_04455 [Thermoguttaceae bacterium]|nr:hypothetical protein [Thermoguttaceae bacterium]MBQ6829461.1 hypothetical protein [Thermoguttaceae bacterium]MBQ7110477.1 hypothetical protein [Thermoguttaceae bacterium]